MAIAFVGTQQLKAQLIINGDMEINQMVKLVSPDSLKYFIKSLLVMGTRNTLGSQNDPKKGIGAARKWVLSKFNEFAKQSNGILTAFTDTTTLPPDGKRVDASTRLS